MMPSLSLPSMTGGAGGDARAGDFYGRSGEGLTGSGSRGIVLNIGKNKGATVGGLPSWVVYAGLGLAALAALLLLRRSYGAR